MSLSPDDIERFTSKISVAGPDECWPWTAGVDWDGYGIFWANGTSWRAHRVAYILDGGNPDEGMVLHSCDNPPCCNPRHLRNGTALDNNREARDKGRYAARPALRSADSYVHGAEHHKAKLTEADILDIRVRFDTGSTIESIHQLYPHVTWENIAAIAKRRTWKHLDPRL